MKYENNERLREYLDRGAAGAYREHLRHPRFEFNDEAFGASLDQVSAQFPGLSLEEAEARAAFRLLTSGVAPEVAAPLPSRWFRARTFVREKSARTWPWLKLAWAISVLVLCAAAVAILSALVVRAEPTPQNMQAIRRAMRGVSLLAASPAGFALPAAAAPQQPGGIILQFQQGGSALATRPAGLVAFNCGTGMNCSFTGSTFTLTSTGAGGGSGCTPPGTPTRILYDDGAGGCLDSGLTWASGTSTAAAPSGVTLTYSGTGIINARKINNTEFSNSESLGKIPIGQGDGTAVWADPLVQGLTSHDAVGTSTNPVLTGGYASGTAPTDVSNDGDAVRAWFLRNGSQVFNLASGGSLVTQGQKAMASSLPVTIASDQSAVTITQTAPASLRTQLYGYDGSAVQAVGTNGSGVLSTLQSLGALGDGEANVGRLGTGSNQAILGNAPYMFNGSNWDRFRGNATDGLLVNLGANNDVTVTGAVTVTGSVTANAGTNLNTSALSLEATQADVRTSVQLIDDTVHTDDTSTHSTASTKVIGIGAVATPTDAAVNANDIGMPAMSVNRELFGVIRDAAGNARGANVNASNQLLVNCANCSGSGASAADNSTFTAGSDSVAPAGLLYDTTPPAVTDGNVGLARMDSSRRTIVACEVGCGGSTFEDNDAFTFNTTNASPLAAVVDDVSTNTVAENSAGTPRMSSNRVLYVDLVNTQANSTAIKVDGSAVTQPVSAASLPLPSGASTLAEQQTQTTALQLIDNIVSGAGANISQFGGSNVATGTGASGAGIPRVTLSNDSSLAANQSVNVAQMNGVATTMGNGAAGTGVQRVTIASDSTGHIGAVLDAETTKVIGTVRMADGSGNLTFVDPCRREAKTYTPFSQTAGAQLIAGTASERLYICSISIVTATAQNVALVSGTGTVCATSTGPLMGGTTAATGWNFAANGGLTLGNGDSSLAQTDTNADNVCLLQSGSGQLSGVITSVSQ